ncbi:MAG: STAS domain-containing protein [Nocardioidaceae bacterium]|nr:STAS domain-containing protein [Nocardioidaceae bacterium]
MNATDRDAGAGLDVTTLRRSDAIWVDVTGEADISNVDVLRDALAVVELDRATVHLELSHLDFADVASIRALGAFADHVRDRGHRLVVHGTPPVVAKVARITGLDPTLWQA